MPVRVTWSTVETPWWGFGRVRRQRSQVVPNEEVAVRLTIALLAAGSFHVSMKAA